MRAVRTPSKGSVALERSHCALVIVDMQNDFVRRKGSLYVPRAERTLSAISTLLGKAREAGVPVFYTQDWHIPDDPEFKIWGVHALQGSWGAEIVSELAPEEGDTVIRKPRYDAFYATPLDYYLRIKGVNTIVITGTMANVCVLHTAGSAALRWYRVVVPVDCISALNDFDHSLTIRQVDFLYKGTITRSRYIKFSV